MVREPMRQIETLLFIWISVFRQVVVQCLPHLTIQHRHNTSVIPRLAPYLTSFSSHIVILVCSCVTEIEDVFRTRVLGCLWIVCPYPCHCARFIWSILSWSSIVVLRVWSVSNGCISSRLVVLLTSLGLLSSSCEAGLHLWFCVDPCARSRWFDLLSHVNFVSHGCNVSTVCISHSIGHLQSFYGPFNFDTDSVTVTHSTLIHGQVDVQLSESRFPKSQCFSVPWRQCCAIMLGCIVTLWMCFFSRYVRPGSGWRVHRVVMASQQRAVTTISQTSFNFFSICVALVGCKGGFLREISCENFERLLSKKPGKPGPQSHQAAISDETAFLECLPQPLSNGIQSQTLVSFLFRGTAAKVECTVWRTLLVRRNSALRHARTTWKTWADQPRPFALHTCRSRNSLGIWSFDILVRT